MTASDPLRLAGVTHLRLSGRGPKDAFLFDPHRLALPCWAVALGERRAGPALLLTLDRHFDLVPPSVPVPDASAATLEELDTFTRWRLDVRNVDHVLAAMAAGLLGDAVSLARARPHGCLEGDVFVDPHGRRHAVHQGRSVEAASDGFGTGSATPFARAVEQAVHTAGAIILDVDLDCFTSPSDADPTAVVPWTRELIHDYLIPPGSGAFWEAVLEKTVALTLAKEPYHCGGVLAANRLFEAVTLELFVELLGGGPP